MTTPWYATPRDQWPTRAEIMRDEQNQPTVTPTTPDDRADLVAELAALQTRYDRCAVSYCRRALDLHWNAHTCPAGHVAICDSCDWRDACHECDPNQQPVEPTC